MTTTATATDSVIRAEKLTKVYSLRFGRQKVVALDGLDLDVRRGEVFGLLGPNGSGKTTTMKLLLGLIFPTSGRAEVLGLAPGNVNANQRLGFLPEESYFYPFLSADETLDFYGRLFRIPRRERRRRVDALIEQVGLQHARKRAIRGYSKGMSRRIGLAQALINDPDLLILDEPTSGMDPIGTREIKDLILDLKKRGKTVLMSSHLLADVEDVCDRIAIVKTGRLEMVGAVADLLTVKDVTQIKVPNLDDAALARVKSALGDKAAAAEVSHPKSTLEEIFLRIVSQADARDKGNSKP